MKTTIIPTVALLLLSVGATTAGAQEPIGLTPLPSPPPQARVIPDQFIVELKPGVQRDAFIRARGIAALRRYTIINGFAARMSQAAANRLAADPAVRLVSPDVVVQAFARRPPKGGGGGGGTTGTECPATSPATSVPEVVPTGVSRIDAPSAWTSTTGTGVRVGVIDTGIDYCHPDLSGNYKGGINLLDTTKPPKDDNGHGTHVAGIIGAKKNDFGVVGVAPDASLYAVKVLDASGSGSLSLVVNALDWAVKNRMQVVNLSLGAADFWCIFGLCGIGSECTAVTNATAAGVTVVVAAGNSAGETLGYTPANCQDSLTVTAFVDSDGLAGGTGSGFTVLQQPEADDTFAQSFSNHSIYFWDMDGDQLFTEADHPVVDMMAPGVYIRSTMPTYTVTLTDGTGSNLNYGHLTGTSMAAPHVAGAAALYILGHPGATTENIRLGLVENGECPSAAPKNGLECTLGWADDPDGSWEALVRASGL